MGLFSNDLMHMMKYGSNFQDAASFKRAGKLCIDDHIILDLLHYSLLSDALIICSVEVKFQKKKIHSS